MSADFIDLDELTVILRGTEPDGRPAVEEDEDDIDPACFRSLTEWRTAMWPKWTGFPCEQTWYHCRRCGFRDERFYAIFCAKCGKRL